ncbi:MAG: hypothetical protein IKU13_01255 [Clostridia bacterium]|nr:hypothetical protein [Clostridia bacterium]
MKTEKDSSKLLFAVDEYFIEYFIRRLEECSNPYDYFMLDGEISSFNEALYEYAVKEVALSENPIALLVDVVEVEQIRKISDTHRAITLRTRNAIVSWSRVNNFIRVNNKDRGNVEIISPFSNLDYTLLNIYGANLIKSPLPKTFEYYMKKLSEINSDLKCFFYNSNGKLVEQLNIIYDMISEKINIPAGTVKSIGRSSKLIYMEFIKYSSLINNLSIVDVDRLIDLILRQYINSLNYSPNTVTSKLAIHKPNVSILKLR